MKNRSVTVTVKKLVQIKQYEPVEITVSETVTLEEGEVALEVRKKLYASISSSVVKYINHEIAIYK